MSRGYNDYYLWEKKNNFIIQKLLFEIEHGNKLNLTNPITFSEKLVHRKLFSRDPIWPVVTNKISVRTWIADQGYDKYVKLIPTIQIFKNPNDLELTGKSAPCIIKAAWASGLNIFVEDENFDLNQIKAKLTVWSKAQYSVSKLIWATNQMPREFIVEKMLKTSNNELPEDFKFFVFHGKVELIRIHLSRFEDHRHAFYNSKLERLDLLNCKPAAGVYSLPFEINKMISVAEQIGKNFDCVRVDLYLHDSQIYFGEITQTSGSGLEPFDPPSFDLELGKKWKYNSSNHSQE
jgi:hypothetical protein